MKHPNPKRSLHLGMQAGELDDKPYARFWNPRMGRLSEAAREAAAVGPVASALLPSLADLPKLLAPGDAELENGLGFSDDGALHVALRTELPGVTAEMIDWWFGWHSEEPQRYKLWHPRAHVHAAWETPLPGAVGRARYQRRVSFVDEYLGSEMAHVAIQFVAPSRLGLDEAALTNQTAVCARIGYAAQPLDFGWLLHHVRPVAGGAEMRSRFFLGGPHASVRGAGRLGEMAARAVTTFVKPTLDNGRDLLIHCAQEMAHLGTFLPSLYEEQRGR